MKLRFLFSSQLTINFFLYYYYFFFFFFFNPGNTTQAEALRRILVDDYFTPLANITPEVSVKIGTEGNGDVEEEPIKPLQPKALPWYLSE